MPSSLSKWINENSLLLFVLLTYAITWSIEIPPALAAHGLATFRVSKGLQTFATLSPGVAALLLFGAKRELKRLWKGLKRWQVPLKWYLFVLTIAGLCALLALIVFEQLSPIRWILDPWYSFLLMLLVFLPFSPFWEEIGWRGFLLPSLQAKWGAWRASVGIGFVWGLWHLPIYLTINPEGERTLLFFLYFLLGTFPISILFTWLYNRTSGSLFVSILFHAALNATLGFFFSHVPTGELHPFAITMLFFSGVSIGVLLNTKGRLAYPPAD